ncbi:UNVERIFIED_CONTAM: hypothetical protein K2H54_031359 [Gekko kuhli]
MFCQNLFAFFLFFKVPKEDKILVYQGNGEFWSQNCTNWELLLIMDFLWCSAVRHWWSQTRDSGSGTSAPTDNSQVMSLPKLTSCTETPPLPVMSLRPLPQTHLFL